jgi:hypothetical protein
MYEDSRLGIPAGNTKHAQLCGCYDGKSFYPDTTSDSKVLFGNPRCELAVLKTLDERLRLDYLGSTTNFLSLRLDSK